MGKEYTKNQIDAINCIDQNLQLIACAGSGKTEIVSKRAVNILKSKKDIKPENIVAFTFTEKAAEELKSRIYEKSVEELGEVYGLAEMYVGTIHSFCLKILQDYLAEYQKFTVLDDVKTKIFIDRNFDEIGMKQIDMARYKDTDIFMNSINILRESELEKKKLLPKIKKALEEYNACFLKHNYFDFSMIMEKAINHLEEDKDLRKRISSRIKYLIVDEYQDVNPIQEKLIRIIHELGANLCVVGDDDQTIYQWRGSEVQNILTFQKRYHRVKSIYLEDNFRSSEGIIDIAHSTILNNIERLPKKMKVKGDYKYEEEDIIYREFIKEEDEWQFIAKTIKSLLKIGLNYSDIAILIRIKRLGSQLIRVLEENGIKFIVEGVNELFSTPEAQASKAIFDYLNGNIDKGVLKSVWLSINYRPNEKLLDDAIGQLKKWLPGRYKFYHDYIFQTIFQEFLDNIELKEEESSLNPDLEIILYNLGKFSQVIHDFESIYFKTPPESKLNSFCSFLNYTAGDYYPEGHLQNAYIRPNAVRIMTIHQAKGLEFGAVFVPGLSKNIFPHKRPGGKSVWHYLDKSLIKNQQRYESGNIEDERRLFYVAVTRAKKFLYLTRAVYNQRMNRYPSSFLIEAKHSHFIFDGKVDYSGRQKIKFETKEPTRIMLNFSILKDYYSCPYRFKLSFFYGFVQPIAPPMGYGRALHNIVMDIHRKVTNKEKITEKDLGVIIDGHFHLPYADERTTANMRKNADRSIADYFNKNCTDFDKIKFIEKNIEINFGNGVRVSGRIDLVKRKDIGEKEKTFIVDFKTAERTIIEDVTEEQLKIYAIGYKELTGEDADFIEVYNLDNNEPTRKKIEQGDLKKTKSIIFKAAEDIVENRLNKVCNMDKCKNCYLNYLCLTEKKKKEFKIKE